MQDDKLLKGQMLSASKVLSCWLKATEKAGLTGLHLINSARSE
ncbi:hypothetical protein SynPROSU1_01536 [Synechococcus sp. PROS-U-1]|nr:hypothetical protein SynPROSU1_01536 [Synechococcus sp. PROS-U-1]